MVTELILSLHTHFRARQLDLAESIDKKLAGDRRVHLRAVGRGSDRELRGS